MRKLCLFIFFTIVSLSHAQTYSFPVWAMTGKVLSKTGDGVLISVVEKPYIAPNYNSAEQSGMRYAGVNYASSPEEVPAWRKGLTEIPTGTYYLKKHPQFLHMVDDDPIKAVVREAGTFQYKDASGVTRTVRAYEFVRE